MSTNPPSYKKDQNLRGSSLMDCNYLLSSIINNSNNFIIFALDKNYCYTAFNNNHIRAMKRIWSVDIEIGMNMLDIIKNTKDQKKSKLHFDRAFKGESFTVIEKYGKKPDCFFYENTYNPVFNDQGRITGLSVFLVDVTDKVQTQKELNKYHNQLERLVQKRTQRLENVKSRLELDIIKRKQTEERLIFNINRIDKLRDIVEKLIRVKSMEDAYSIVIESILTVIQADRGSILLADPDSVVRFKAWNGLSDKYRASTEGHFPWDLSNVEAKPIIIENISNADLSKELITTVLNEGIHACSFIPLVGSDQLLGKFMTYYNHEHKFTPDEINVSLVLADNLSTVIERILGQEAVAESERKYRTVVENANDIIFQVDLDGNFLFINPTAIRLTGFSKEELLSMDYRDLVHSKDINRLFELYQDSYQKQKSVPYFEFRVVTKSGKIIWLGQNNNILIEQGAVIGWQNISRDITALKQVEKDLYESEERYRGLSKAAFEAIFISEKGICLEQNTTAEKMFGYTLSEAVGRNGTEWIIPSDREMVMRNMLSGYEGSYEATALRKNGTTFPCEIQARMMKYKGRKVRVTALRDITKRKEAEEKLFQSREQYKSAFDLFRLMTDNSPDLLWAKDLEGKYLFTNKAICETLLHATDTTEPIGKTDIFFAERERAAYPNNPDWHTFGELCVDSDKVTIEKGEVCRFDEYGNISGQLLFLDVYKAPLRNETGDIIGTVGSARIVTRERELEMARKKAIEAMSESEEKFRSIVENSMDVIMLTQPDGIISYMSPACSQVLGYEPEDLIGKQPWIIHPDDVGIVREVHRDALSGKKHPRLEYRIITNVGDTRWISHSYTPVFTENRLRMIVSFLRDITERKQAEKQILRLSQGVEQSPASIIITDGNGIIEYVNPKFEELTGYSSKEAVGQNPKILKSGVHESEYYNELWQTITSGKEWQGEFCNRKKNGELYWESVQISAITDSSGTIINFIAIKEDITQRKQMEKVLKESEQKFRGVIEQSNDGIYVIQNNRFVFINPRFTEISGYQLEDISGNDFNFKKLFTEEGRKVFEERVKKQKRGEILPSRYVFKARCKNGEKRDMEVSVTTINWQGQSATLGILNDVTERIQTQNELKQALEKAKQGEKVKTLFLANMSHEIRTPLNAILGYTELIESNTRHLVGKEQQQFFDTIRNSGQRLLHTVHEILDISQIEAGTYSAKVEKFDLCKCLSELIMEYHQLANAKDLQIVYNRKINKAMVAGDSYGISQAIRNIIENAIKYTVKGKVTISLNKKKDQFILVIEDTGIGMSDEYQKKMFKAFSQESEGLTKKFQGIGLGMSIVKHHMDLNKIDLDIQSTKGVGTRVTLTFTSIG